LPAKFAPPPPIYVVKLAVKFDTGKSPVIEPPAPPGPLTFPPLLYPPPPPLQFNLTEVAFFKNVDVVYDVPLPNPPSITSPTIKEESAFACVTL
jgi:hypothetical protein